MIKKVAGERERDEGNAQTRKVRDSLRATTRGELIKINIRGIRVHLVLTHGTHRESRNAGTLGGNTA